MDHGEQRMIMEQIDLDFGVIVEMAVTKGEGKCRNFLKLKSQGRAKTKNSGCLAARTSSHVVVFSAITPVVLNGHISMK